MNDNGKTEEDNSTSACLVGCCLGAFLTFLLFGESQDLSLQHKEINAGKLGGIVESKKESNFLLRQIDNYQINIAPKIKEKVGREKICKYEPTCSEYAKQAIKKYGSFKGSLIASSRLLRCNPFSKGGHDPIK